MVHLNSTADQHLGLVLHALTSLSVLYIQKQLHWLAGFAKKKEKFKKDPALTTISSHLRVQQQEGKDPSLSRALARSIQNQTAQDILTHGVLQVTLTGLIPPSFSKEKKSRFPFTWTWEHPGLIPHHHPNKASWSLTLHLHWTPTLKKPSKNQWIFAFSWTSFKGAFLMHLWLSTQKSPEGTYDPLDFQDPQPVVVVLSDLLHCRGKHNVTSGILGGSSTSLPSK